VTIRTNFDQLTGGASEETIIPRVCQGIVTAIGSAPTHMHVPEMPERISKAVLERGLDANTAFEIGSLAIAEVDVGQHIGARLRADQAAADTRMVRAQAESRPAEAIALQQEMKAKVPESRAMLLLAEAEMPVAIAVAFPVGQFRAKRSPRRHRKKSETQPVARKSTVRAILPVDQSPIYFEIENWETEGGACSRVRDRRCHMPQWSRSPRSLLLKL
jgi:uncharacterized protein YqfA (UPF0365 family)